MTPFFLNPAFLPALQATEFGPWSKQEYRRFSQVLQSDPSLLLSSLSAMSSGNSMHWLQTHQVMSYIRSIPSPLDILTEPYDLEYLLIQKEPPTHTVSLLYTYDVSTSRPSSVWEKDPQQTISPSDWQKCLPLTHNISSATKT